LGILEITSIFFIIETVQYIRLMAQSSIDGRGWGSAMIFA
jgi:hypothetical protein